MIFHDHVDLTGIATLQAFPLAIHKQGHGTAAMWILQSLQFHRFHKVWIARQHLIKTIGIATMSALDMLNVLREVNHVVAIVIFVLIFFGILNVRHKPVELQKDSQKVQACGLTLSQITVVPGPAREFHAQQMTFSKSSSFRTLLLCIEFGSALASALLLASAEPSGKLRRSMTSRQSTRRI